MVARGATLERELRLALELDRGIEALRRGEPLQTAGKGSPDVAPLLEVASSLLERGKRARDRSRN
jgi:hypothetical protein